jgi:hypothetical protein
MILALWDTNEMRAEGDVEGLGGAVNYFFEDYDIVGIFDGFPYKMVTAKGRAAKWRRRKAWGEEPIDEAVGSGAAAKDALRRWDLGGEV